MSADKDDKRGRQKELRWPPLPESERPHERARRGLNRLIYGVDTKRRIAPD
jgi:hypothetical protein